MKPIQKSPSDDAPLLAFGAHPDDIEFGCGGVIAKETGAGRTVHMVVCSSGEAATHGSPEERENESRKAAAILGASVEFIEFDGDAHLEIRIGHALKIAEIIRRVKPAIVLAPSLLGNQHPDHTKLGEMVRNAARLARYGNLADLHHLAAHAIEQLFFYNVTCEEDGRGAVFVDVSNTAVMAAWTGAMEAHASQLRTRNYVELQLARARVNGLRAGVGHAIALYPNDPIVVESLAQLGRGARAF